MANFVSSLTGEELNQALMLTNLRESERWAVGTAGGIPVPVADETHDNNSKAWAERAEDAANRAEAAVPAGTAGAVLFDRSLTLTDAQAMQARANIVAGGSNPNLFMNPWFTVNQRNARGNLANGYCMDRWRVFVSGGTVNFNQSTRVITLSATSNVSYIQQVLDPNLRSALNGKTVTFSVLTSANVVHSVTFTYSSTTTDTGITFPTFPQAGYWYGADYSSCLRLSHKNSTVTVTLSIKAIKFELGSVSTIANDMPPDYGEELAKCQRYFVRIPKQVNQPYGFGFAQSGSIVRIAIPIPATMRDVPTISYTAGFTLRGGGSSLSPSSVSVLVSAPVGCVNLEFTVSGATEHQVYVLSSTEASYIDLSADL